MEIDWLLAVPGVLSRLQHFGVLGSLGAPPTTDVWACKVSRVLRCSDCNMITFNAWSRVMQLSAPWSALEPSRSTKAAGPEALDAAQKALRAARAYGKVLVVATYHGRIQVLENLARPHWL